MLRAVVAAGATAALWLRAYYDFSSRRASDGAQEVLARWRLYY